MKAIYREVEISRVADDDQSFLLTPSTESCDNLLSQDTDSILRLLLLNPPLLQPFGNSFRIVAGSEIFQAYKRTAAAGPCSCLILDDAAEPLELLALALEHITIKRKPSPVEEAVCLQKAINAGDKENAVSFFAPLLAMTRRYTPDSLLSLLKLNTVQLAALHEGRLEIATAFTLLEMAEGERNEVFRFITDFRLSASNQRKLIRSCIELANRRNSGISGILSDPEVHRISRDHALENSNKTTRIMEWLHKQLFPNLSAAEAEFSNFVDNLVLPRNSELGHAPSFEKDSLTFKCTFSDRKDFSAKLPELKRIINKHQ